MSIRQTELSGCIHHCIHAQTRRPNLIDNRSLLQGARWVSAGTGRALLNLSPLERISAPPGHPLPGILRHMDIRAASVQYLFSLEFMAPGLELWKETIKRGSNKGTCGTATALWQGQCRDPDS